ncbi:hypothetical protein PIROE2DRAFT_14497 [Piromyces sp. E2]|nr:hypothetical protein PIROE2DRAFT_14497 [Piromyces sp. E2]|eukprot:OUM59865.1 hypothetical protein PIROE2DRAFT_14497 [Piromyces sp. E2]
MKPLFKFNLTHDTFVAVLAGISMIVLSLLMIPFSGESILDNIVSFMLRDVMMIFGLGIVFISFFVDRKKKEVLSDIGFSRNKLKLSLILNLIFAVSLLAMFMKKGVPDDILNISNFYAAVYILTAGIFEMTFIYGYLRMSFENALGTIPAILLTSAFYSFHHAVGALWDVIVSSEAGEGIKNIESFGITIFVWVLIIGFFKYKHNVEHSNAEEQANNSNNICITKPRRFGKTSIAAMLVTYYSKGIDSKKIFDKLKVSKGKSSNQEKKEKEIIQYEKFQGKYHTIYLDFSHDVDTFETLNDYLSSINQILKKDIKKLYPNSEILNDYDNRIYINLENLYIERGEKFIFIIDEWDFIIANNMFTPKERGKFIAFLNNLIKDQAYIAFVYMTGILPIAKQLSQTSLNCFKEYSMLKDEKYYRYFGFTEQEVQNLYNKSKTLKYTDLKNWCNGYRNYKGEKIFNPWSVIQSLEDKAINNYRTQTGRSDDLVNILNFNISGVKEDILELISGKKITMRLKNYGAEDIQKELKKKKIKNNDKMKRELYSKMVTLGFLTYYNGKISIPNEDLREIFIEVLDEDDDLKYYYDLIEDSKKMLKMTLKKNTDAMCEILENSHVKKIKSGDKFDHGNLKYLIDFLYFSANASYNINKEGTVIILELKVNDSAKTTIKHIHEKRYYFGLKDKGYKGNILLIGINCDTENKKYTCIIEEYDCDLNIKLPKSEKKRKNNPIFEGIF